MFVTAVKTLLGKLTQQIAGSGAHPGRQPLTAQVLDSLVCTLKTWVEFLALGFLPSPAILSWAFRRQTN